MRKSSAVNIESDINVEREYGDDEHNQLYRYPISLPLKEQIKLQTQREIIFIKKYWRYILCMILYQWVHNVATNLAYYLHRPGPMLRDMGFELFNPKLAESASWITELFTFGTLLLCLCFVFSPFYLKRRKKLYFTLTFMRYGFCVCIIETLRCISFLGTILPSPAPHCQPNSPDYDPPSVFNIFFRFDVLKGCGDLIFSGHTTYTLTAVMAVNSYADDIIFRGIIWCLALAMGILIIAARKHYTVDIVVAWYTIPMVWTLVWNYYKDPYPEELFMVLKEQNASENENVEMSNVDDNV